MGWFKLPNERAMSDAFKESGLPNVVMIDVFPIEGGEKLKLTFESVKSNWRQGVWLATDQYVIINGQKCRSADLWQDTAPREVLIECHTRDKVLHLYNIWDNGRRDSQAWTSGMLIQELPAGRRYRCNDIGFAKEFTKLVFRLERVRDRRSPAKRARAKRRPILG